MFLPDSLFSVPGTLPTASGDSGIIDGPGSYSERNPPLLESQTRPLVSCMRWRRCLSSGLSRL